MGVQTLKTVEDLIFLKEFVRTPYVRDIVILGGSWAGLEIAKSFLKLGRNVRIIEKEQQLLPQFDPEVSKLIQKELEAQGVQFNLGEQVRSFPGRTFVEQVQTNRGTYPCDLCVVAIGVTPNTGLLAGTGAQLAPNGAVLIGADLATSVPNIYAVGDCAACRDGSLRRSRYFYAFTIFSPAPSSHVRRLLAVISISRCRASLVAHAMCGVSRAFGRPRKGLACGSGSVPKASAP